MKNTITNLKVKELNKEEYRKVQGGGFGPFNFGLSVGASLYNKLMLQKVYEQKYKNTIA